MCVCSFGAWREGLPAGRPPADVVGPGTCVRRPQHHSGACPAGSVHACPSTAHTVLPLVIHCSVNMYDDFFGINDKSWHCRPCCL